METQAQLELECQESERFQFLLTLVMSPSISILRKPDCQSWK